MKFRLKPIAAAVLAFHALPGTAQETLPPAAEPATQLPAVKVQDEAINEYKADRVSSPKFTQPLVNTTQTISVVKKEVMAEQGALSLSDALRNTPGITFQAGENGNTTSGDAIFLRGFDTQGSIFLDNIRDLGASVRDLFNIEQVEIVKGPSGADNGRGAASGYINLASKTPFADNAISGTASYGSAERRRVTTDINQKVGEHSAVRLNLVGQDGGVAGRDFIERQQWGIAPSLALGLGTATRITLFSQHIQQNNTPDGGVSAIGISGYRNLILEGRDANGNATNSTGTAVIAQPVDSDNFYGLDDDFEDLRANMFTVRIEHDLRPGLTVRNTSRYGDSDQARILTAPLQAPVVSDDPDGTGPMQPVVRADPNTWTQGRSRQASYRDNQILTNQTNLTSVFKTGAIEHSLTSGVEFIYESQFTPTYAVVGAAQAPANLYNPNRTDAAATLAPNGAFSDGDTTTAAIYAFDTIKLSEKVQLNGGLRVERYKTATDSASLSTAAANPTLPVGTLLPVHIEGSDNLISYKVGALYKPRPEGSIYVAYANSLRPPSGDNFTLSAATTATGAPNANINSPALDPQEATNIELGTKWDLLGGKLAVTAALFQSENKNDLARAADDSIIQYGKRKVEGLELGLVGQLAAGWQASLGYTHQKSKVSEGALATDGTSTQTGAVINFSPKNSATLWTTYDVPLPLLPRPLTLGGGFRYVDSQARTVNNNLASVTSGIVEVKSYTVFDAMASYEVTQNLGVQFNVYNLADEDYVASVNNSGARYFPDIPRSFLVTLNAKF